jgi:chromosome segregation ATPase
MTPAFDPLERIAFLEREVARLRKGEECHVARPGEGTYECRHDNLCAACRLRSAEARANRTSYTVGETEWAHRIANAEQKAEEAREARDEAEQENVKLKEEFLRLRVETGRHRRAAALSEERALTAEERLERVTHERDQERKVFEQAMAEAQTEAAHRIAVAERRYLDAEAECAEMRALLADAHRELATIEAITVSPSGVDGLMELVNRIGQKLEASK